VSLPRAVYRRGDSTTTIDGDTDSLRHDTMKTEEESTM
jgi:hypothetical protein